MLLECRCTIDWFLPWPEEALTEVAGKYINDFPMACLDTVKINIRYISKSWNPAPSSQELLCFLPSASENLHDLYLYCMASLAKDLY